MNSIRVFESVSYIEKNHVSSVEEAIKESKLLVANFTLYGKTLTVPEKAQMVLRLAPFLVHRACALAENLAGILIILTDEQSHLLPSSVVLAVMRHAVISLKSFMSFQQAGEIKQRILVLEILENLVCNEQNQRLIASSQGLHYILHLFRSYLESKHPCEPKYVSKILDVLLTSAKGLDINHENQVTISEFMIPVVFRYLQNWMNNPTTSTNPVLRKILFATREIIFRSKDCQLIVLSNNGLDLLSCILQKSYLFDWIIYKPITRGSAFIDHSPTLFSSFVMLLDAIITRNETAIKKAQELKIAQMLELYLESVPKENLYCVISTLMHIFEYDFQTVSWQLKDKIHKAVSPPFDQASLPSWMIEVIKVTKPRSAIKGTPHPRKSLPLKIKKSTFDCSTPSIEDRLVQKDCPESQEKQTNGSIRENFKRAAAVLPETLQNKETFISMAELIIFMKYVKIYGVNMKSIRKVYPFHKHLTPGDLYALWRAIWGLK